MAFADGSHETHELDHWGKVLAPIRAERAQLKRRRNQAREELRSSIVNRKALRTRPQSRIRSLRSTSMASLGSSLDTSIGGWLLPQSPPTDRSPSPLHR
jgi:hypothetical protein